MIFGSIEMRPNLRVVTGLWWNPKTDEIVHATYSRRFPYSEKLYDPVTLNLYAHELDCDAVARLSAWQWWAEYTP